ncbi:MAG: 50S ribosomal protein L11 methyltransferase [Bacillota bacterium]|jgi:ribosomal protein L11 methyltransferase
MEHWLEVEITLPVEEYRQSMDLVSIILIESGAGGVVLEDPALLADLIDRGSVETVALQPEQAAIAPAVKAYFPVDGSLPGVLEEIRQALGRIMQSGDYNLKTRQVARQDWNAVWRAYYKPVKVGRRLVVRPVWEEYGPVANELVITLDPGLAFGCGAHPTTSMCLRLLEEYIRGGEMVCDVGTGSGILAVAAAHLGARRVLAVDLDELAVQAARENVARNGLEDVVQVARGNLLDMVFGRADLVVANILADVVITMVPEVGRVLAPGGRFIASGIIKNRGGEVRRAIHAAGLDVEQVCMDGQWLALVAGKETWRF